MFYRVDDNGNIIVVNDIQELPEHVAFNLTTYVRNDGFKPVVKRLEINAKKQTTWGRKYYYNLIFADELPLEILNEHLHRGYILLVQYDEKNKIYDLLIYYSQIHINIERWCYQDKWIKTGVLKEGYDYYKFNMFFHRQCIVCYTNETLNFGSIVPEKYSDWRKRMLLLLGEMSVLRAFSMDVLGLWLDYVESVELKKIDLLKT